MHLSITVPPFSSAHVALLGGVNYFKIVQNHDGLNQEDMISRNGLMVIHAGTQLSLTSNFVNSYIRWFLFRLDNCFSPVIVFQVARSYSTTNINHSELISFDLILMNIGSAWKTFTNSFVAPQSGQYFFSLSAGMSGNKTTVMMFFVINDETVQHTDSGVNALFSSGYNQISVSKLLSLNNGDICIFTTKFYRSLHSNPSTLQISLTGFYYSPFYDFESMIIKSFLVM